MKIRKSVHMHGRLTGTGALACTRGASACSAIALLAYVAPLAAQAAAAEGDPGSSALSEIVVTAQRRAERLEDVPASVTAISSDQIKKSNITRFQDLGELSAGVSISRSGAFTQPAIRGISTLALGSAIENNVALYVDGFYQNDVVAINADIANISGVEILKGPQGALYGRNATGGAILVSTLAPSHELTGKLMAGYGNLDDRRFSAYVAGPLAEGLYYSIAAYDHENHGYLRDVGTKSNPALDDGFWSAPLTSRSLRTKLEWDATPNLTATLGYNYSYIDDPRSGTWVMVAQLPANFNLGRDTTARDTSSLNYQNRWPATTNEGQLTVKWKTPIGTLSSYTGYTFKKYDFHYDVDGTKLDTSTTIAPGKDQTYQQSVDYAIDVIPRLDLVVGGMLYGDQLNLVSRSVSNFTLIRSYNAKEKTHAYAAFFDGTYHLTDKLFLTVGGRYSHEEKGIFSSTRSVVPAASDYTTPGYVNTTFTAFTPRAVIRYNIGERSNIYASVSTGFKSGVYNAVSYTTLSSVTPAKQEKVTAYEVGFKTAGRRLRFDTAAFYYDYTNIQTSLTVLNNPNNPALGLTTFLQNAPKAKIYGAEASGTWSPIDRLNVGLGAAYLHARYTDFPNWSGAGLNPITNLNVTSPQDLSHQTMVRAPTWSGNFSADYTWDALGGSLRAAFNAPFSSDYIPNNPSTFQSTQLPANRTQRYVASGYILYNASLAWTAPGDHITFTAWGKNLADDRYRLTYSGNAFGTYTMYAEPRTWGATIEYKF
jgi:iron complex outermembrane receptor protein